jgi:hypothetical protein
MWGCANPALALNYLRRAGFCKCVCSVIIWTPAQSVGVLMTHLCITFHVPNFSGPFAAAIKLTNSRHIFTLHSISNVVFTKLFF